MLNEFISLLTTLVNTAKSCGTPAGVQRSQPTGIMTQPARKGSRREMLTLTAYPHTVHAHLLHWKLKHEANNGYSEATLYRQCSHLQMQVLEQSSTAMRFTAYNHITTRGYVTEPSFILLLAPPCDQPHPLEFRAVVEVAEIATFPDFTTPQLSASFCNFPHPFATFPQFFPI